MRENSTVDACQHTAPIANCESATCDMGFQPMQSDVHRRSASISDDQHEAQRSSVVPSDVGNRAKTAGGKPGKLNSHRTQRVKTACMGWKRMSRVARSSHAETTVRNEPKSLTTRRQFLATSAALALGACDVSDAQAGPPSTTMGLAGDGWTIHRKAGRDADPLSFLQACHEMKMGGIQCPLNFKNPDDAKKLRSQAEQWGMYVEASIPLVTGSAERFEREVLIAKDAGIGTIRTVLFPGRRYESLHTPEQFVDATKHAIETLTWAEPIAAKHAMILAIENHKDQRINERISMMKQFDSEHVGICVDVGNSFALCEDPLETVKAYAPWARAVHIKDQAAAECPEGFLYGDEALGEGALDLPAMVDVLRAVRPNIRFSLEVITRDPLLVPVLAKRYWATMPEVPATDLAKTLNAVKLQKRTGFPQVSAMSKEQQLQMEASLVQESISFAVAHLKMSV